MGNGIARLNGKVEQPPGDIPPEEQAVSPFLKAKEIRALKVFSQVVQGGIRQGPLTYNDIKTYFEMGQCHRNSPNGFTMKLQDIIFVEKQNEQYARKPGKSMFLWHGTKRKNIRLIIRDGMKVPTKDNVTRLAGKGIYFADIASKSGQYAKPKPGKLYAILLCEVALGRPHKLLKWNNKLKGPSMDFDSVVCYGTTVPDPTESKSVGGCVLPCGSLEHNEDSDVCITDDYKQQLNYNEYVVYNPSQIKVLYIVTFECA